MIVGPHQLGPGIYLLSTGAQQGYLVDLALGSGGNGSTWVWIDPGPAEALPDLLEKTRELLGPELERLALLVASHLDPDALGAIPELCRRARRARVMMPQETWNFASLTGIPEARVVIAERFRHGFRLPETGRGFDVVLTPYSQYTAAFLLYEPQSATLFSADLLAGGGDVQSAAPRWATDCDWPRVAAYQMRHMPCSAAIRWSLEQIAALPRLELICPHHGGLLRGEVMRSFLARLGELPVGADLLAGPGEAAPNLVSSAAAPPSCQPAS